MREENHDYKNALEGLQQQADQHDGDLAGFIVQFDGKHAAAIIHALKLAVTQAKKSGGTADMNNGCEACDNTGRVELYPDDDDRFQCDITHPCDDCQPEVFKEYMRGFKAGKRDATFQPDPLPQHVTDAIKRVRDWAKTSVAFVGEDALTLIDYIEQQGRAP